MTRVSIHVCVRDRPNYLPTLFASLYKQTFKDWDLILIDDYSKTPVKADIYSMEWIQFLRNEKHYVKVIRNPVWYGITKSRNQAIIEDDTDNELVLRVDSDSFMEPDYLEKLHTVLTGISDDGKSFFRNRAHVNSGAVGGIVPYLARPRYYKNANKLKWFNETIIDKKGNIKHCGDDGHFSWHPNRIIQSHHLRSSFLCWRDVFSKVGLYENSLGGATGFREETYFCFKLMQKGYTLWTDTSALSWHAPGQGRDFGDRRYEEMVKQHDVWFREHSKPILKELGEKGIITVE